MEFNVCIAAIFKNENAYLQEWIAFHRLVGIDHFFLYDNDGSAETKQLLRPYVDQGVITLHPWTHLNGSRHDRATHFGGRDKNHMAFNHAASHYRDCCNWLLKIDIDEFLMPTDGNDIRAVIEKYDRDSVRGVEIPRIDFGDSGHRSRPDGLVIESYTLRESEISDHKDLANTSFLTKNRFNNSAHSWRYRPFKRGRLVSRDEVSGMRINHYYTKSLEESLVRQNMMVTRPKTEAEFIQQNLKLNELRDESMLRFSPSIKKEMGQ